MTEQKIHFSINEGDPFFSHDTSINFNPAQFIFDFRCVTPRIDPRTNDGSRVMQLKHNVVMLEPYHAKQIMEVLTDMVQKYEKKFGKIVKPKAITKLEKEVKASDKSGKKKTEEIIDNFPNYLG